MGDIAVRIANRMNPKQGQHMPKSEVFLIIGAGGHKLDIEAYSTWDGLLGNYEQTADEMANLGYTVRAVSVMEG